MEHRRAVGQRIRVLREALGMSRQQFAEALGVHPGSVARWETGGAVPVPYQVDRMAEMGGTTPAWIRYGEGTGPQLTPMAPARGHAPMVRGPRPNYDSLGIDLPGYERLLERPRRLFDSFMLELIRRGLGREDIEELGRGVLAPIAAMNTLHKGRHEADATTEEAQFQVLNALIPVTLKHVDGGDA